MVAADSQESGGSRRNTYREASAPSHVPKPNGATPRATRQQQVPERRRPERRRPLPAALRRGGRPGGLQAQHAPHHLDVVVPAGLHVPVEVHDPSALCVAAGNVQRKGKVLVWTETLLDDDIALANTFIACHRSYTSDHSFHQKQKMYP